MLLELAVANLGVIERVTLDIPPGMIALTGETGAGKTLLVDAINLLVGGRSDPALVRPGADEATIDGRFLLDGDEYILTRVVPADGRSRAYVNGRPSTASALAELGARLVDLHGQHAHQSLLGVDAQRNALDAYGKVDLSGLAEARAQMAEIDAALAELGGDERARARELDLVTYQVGELAEADLQDPHEDDRLAERQELLSNASAHQEAAGAALEVLIEDGGARDRLSQGLTLLEGAGPFEESAGRIKNLLADLDDIADAVRSVGDGIEDDPQALDQVLARRRMLRELCRKYGDDVQAVMAERDALQLRLKELEDHDVVAADLDRRRQEATAALAEASQAVREAKANRSPPTGQGHRGQPARSGHAEGSPGDRGRG